MEDIRDVVSSSIDFLRGLDVKLTADIAAALERRAFGPLNEIIQQLEKRIAPSR
jgi:hypothetical protein